VLGPTRPDIGWAWHFLGIVYQQMKDFDSALKCYDTCKKIFLERSFHEHPFYANTLIQTAGIYYLKGDKVQALKLYKESLTIYNQNYIGKPFVFVLEFMIALVLVDLEQNYQEVNDLFKSLLNRYANENPETKDAIAKTWVKIQYEGIFNGNFSLANKIYHARMKFINKYPGEFPCISSLIKLQMARNNIVHRKELKYKKTIRILRKVFAQMMNKIFVYFPSQIESCLYCLGHLCFEQNIYKTSHKYFLKCLKIRQLHYHSEPCFLPAQKNEIPLLCKLEDELLSTHREFSVEASKAIFTIYDRKNKWYISWLRTILNAKKQYRNSFLGNTGEQNKSIMKHFFVKLSFCLQLLIILFISFSFFVNLLEVK